MKTFNEFISEDMRKLDFMTKEDEVKYSKLSPLNKPFKVNGWEFQSVVHAAARAYTRRPDMDIDAWKKMHRTVVEWLRDNKPANNSEYLFFSKSADQSYIVAINTKRRIAKIVTVLPKGKSFPKAGTEKVIVERFNFNLDNIIEID